MQIKGLHKNFYKLYAYGGAQETLEKYRKEIEGKVRGWKNLKSRKLDLEAVRNFVLMVRVNMKAYQERGKRSWKRMEN